jgi:hypothetical protein
MTSPPEFVPVVDAIGDGGTAVALIGDGGTAVAVEAEETAAGDETTTAADGGATCVGAQPAASNTTAVRINPTRINWLDIVPP